MVCIFTYTMIKNMINLGLNNQEYATRKSQFSRYLSGLSCIIAASQFKNASFRKSFSHPDEKYFVPISN